MTDDRSKAAMDVAWCHSDGHATDQELEAARDAAMAAAKDAAKDAVGYAAGYAAGHAAGAAQKAKLIEILSAGEWI